MPKTINDLKYEYLCDYFGYGYSDGYDIVDLEYDWLVALTGASWPITINDLWDLYLTGLGYTTGTIQDKMSEWLIGLGYSGTIQDMLYDFWAAGVAPTGGYLLDIGEDNITDVDSNKFVVI